MQLGCGWRDFRGTSRERVARFCIMFGIHSIIDTFCYQICKIVILISIPSYLKCLYSAKMNFSRSSWPSYAYRDLPTAVVWVRLACDRASSAETGGFFVRTARPDTLKYESTIFRHSVTETLLYYIQ